MADMTVAITHTNKPAPRSSLSDSEIEGNWLHALKASEFIFQALNNKKALANKLAESYRSMLKKEPGKGEQRSWENSLPALAKVMQMAKLSNQLIILEYCPPSRDHNPSRIDAVICGVNNKNEVHAVLIELKQWSHGIAQASGDFLLIPEGNLLKAKIHPRKQIEEYRIHLRKILEICELKSDFITFAAYAYLHNAFNLTPFEKHALFESDNFDEDSRLYTRDFDFALAKRLKEHVDGGKGEIAFEAFRNLQILAVQNLKKLPKRPNYRWIKFKKNLRIRLKNMFGFFGDIFGFIFQIIFFIFIILLIIGGLWWIAFSI